MEESFQRRISLIFSNEAPLGGAFIDPGSQHNHGQLDLGAQLKLYSIACNSRAGVLCLPQIRFLVRLMTMTGWLVDLSLAWYCNRTCTCTILSTYGPEEMERRNEAAAKQAVGEALQKSSHGIAGGDLKGPCK